MMLQIIVITLIVFMIFAMIAFVMINTQAEKKKRALNIIRGGEILGAGKQKNTQDQRRAELAQKLKDAENKDEKKKGTTLKDLIVHAGLEISIKQFWIFSVLCSILCAAAAKLFGLGDFVVGMAAIIGLLGAPKFILKFKAKHRQKKFIEDFADALEASVRLLKAGMPVTEAIKMTASEFTGPVGEEMSRIYDAQKLGVPLTEAVQMGAQRMPITEMQMFSTAITIQVQTGASLSEVLTNLANVIRARTKLKRKVVALSSEAKISAMIIGSLPIVVCLGLFFIRQDYVAPLFQTNVGKIVTAGAVVWMLIGIFTMRAMINFKV